MPAWNSRATVELVLQARQQQPEAWQALFERCEAEMVRFCRRFMGPRDPLRRIYHSQDIVQEAFATAIRKIESLENDASFYAWVRTIIRHKIAVKRRDELREKALVEGMEEPAAEDTHQTELTTCEESLNVLETILQLFPRYPEPMAIFAMLNLEEDLTPEKLAESLGVSKRTVYRRIAEATRLLRGRLEGEGSNPRS
ncbi:MAG TPA: sigma-70 family RNA polymerase sigma factor [Planctomycetota bacterium]|nr:sigma-70 family RNA polymerase sigma factor [Planctomycetota bacterium]